MESTAFIISGLAIVFIGIFGLLTRRNLIRLLLSLNILATGVNLFLIAVGYAEKADTPIITGEVRAGAASFTDPLPQALVLTAIVIGLGTTAVGLALTLRHYRRTGSLALQKEEEGNAA
jgi:NADH-quinone oxidoreductase subunit K/multicomponent Na+:H+ antiporter subunit C